MRYLWFSAVLAINRVRFSHSSLEMDTFVFERSYFSIIIDKTDHPATKALHKLRLGQLCQPQRS